MKRTDNRGIPDSTSLPKSIMFETSASLLESVDLLLSGQSAPDLTKAPTDADVFSPVTKAKKPSHPSSDQPDARLPPLSLSPALANRASPATPSPGSGRGAGGIGAGIGTGRGKPTRSRPLLPLPSSPSSAAPGSASARRKDVDREAKPPPAPVPALQQMKPHQREHPLELDINFSGGDGTLSPMRTPPLPNALERRHSSPLSLRRQANSPDHHQIPPHRPTAPPSSSTPSLPTPASTPPPTSAPPPPPAPVAAKLDKEALQQLISTIRETVKAEIDENLTDLRNDILNIHSEMVVMASQHSEELRKAVIDRDEGLARLQEENDKLRAENERLQQKYGLFS